GFLNLVNKSGSVVVELSTGSNGVGVISVANANGNVVYRLDGGGAKNFVMAHPTDKSKDIVYASIEGPEAAAYIRGRATLTSGRAQVQLPEHFSLVVNPDTMTVQLTPRSAASKGLAVVESGAGAFAVQELFAGTGTYDFDYFVAGVRKGFEHYEPVVAKGFSPMGHRVTSGDRPPSPGPMPTPSTPSAAATPPAPMRATPPVPTSVPSDKPKPWDVI
ncbi:MAG TPA: hypothetical protein VG097_06050, partial [Gemmata sp.]|nr:hypothetical protein [Gemmata sp.]